ncbi:hypothetical protein ACFW2X_06645 [Streptomyces antibioticus]|uniref:hypothetical protein n=1 Tax=Streptomyces antibioticus TaxID=1890 RepID=UPI0036A6B865
MSAPSADPKAVVRAVNALTAQVRRIADHFTNSIGPDDAQRAQEREYAADIVRALDAKRRHAAEPGQAADTPRCAVCSSTAVTYLNYRDQPFCGPCANGEQPVPAADEDEQRAARRAVLREKLDQLGQRGILGTNAVGVLRELVEAEIREADTARAEVQRWLAFIERGMETHMRFGVLQPDGTTDQLPCADWCYACRLEQAEAKLSESETLGHKLLQRAERAEDELRGHQAAADTLAGRFAAIGQQAGEGIVAGIEGLQQRAEQAEAGRLAADNMLRAVCDVFGGPHKDPIVKARETLARAERAEAAIERVREAAAALTTEADAYAATHNPECECEWVPATLDAAARILTALDGAEATVTPPAVEPEDEWTGSLIPPVLADAIREQDACRDDIFRATYKPAEGRP